MDIYSIQASGFNEAGNRNGMTGKASMEDNYNFRAIAGSNSTSGGGVDDAKRSIGRDDSKGEAEDSGAGNGAGNAGNAANSGGLGGGTSGGSEGSHIVGTEENKDEEESGS
jgi:hypothetical protein